MSPLNEFFLLQSCFWAGKFGAFFRVLLIYWNFMFWEVSFLKIAFFSIESLICGFKWCRRFGKNWDWQRIGAVTEKEFGFRCASFLQFAHFLLQFQGFVTVITNFAEHPGLQQVDKRVPGSYLPKDALDKPFIDASMKLLYLFKLQSREIGCLN